MTDQERLQQFEEWLGVVFQLLVPALRAAQTVAVDKDKKMSDPEIISDVVSHLTPGAPNSPALS